LKIPEITEVSRIDIRPGDRLVVRVDSDLTPEQADYIKEHLRRTLELPDDVRLIVLTHMKVQVLAAQL
jgi:hypothetical protein